MRVDYQGSVALVAGDEQRPVRVDRHPVRARIWTCVHDPGRLHRDQIDHDDLMTWMNIVAVNAVAIYRT
ncbi:MAG: hypothetical protein H0U18_01365 [Pyrinomonadaceae bacterium]|nr:hypothetical protein [Pyrinomonadaceae bacterium]